MKKPTIKILKAAFSERVLFYNFIFKKKFFKNYHITFTDKLYKQFNSFNGSLYLKVFFASLNKAPFYKNFKKNINVNNSALLDVAKQRLFTNSPYIYSNKILKSKKFFNLFGYNSYIYTKENKKYQMSSNAYTYSNNMFYFFIFYWLLLIPLFFIEYVLYRFHLRGHILKKRKLVIFLKVFLDNFKVYIKMVKLLGEQDFYHKHKVKHVRNYLNNQIYRRKRKIKKVSKFFK